MNKNQKIMAALFVAAIMFAVGTVTVIGSDDPYAEESPISIDSVEGFRTSLQTGGNYVLSEDIPLGDIGAVEDVPTVPEGISVVLDLNGHKITANLKTNSGNYAKFQVILNNGTLTINDSIGSGSIANENADSAGCTRTIKNSATGALDINGGSIVSASGVGLLNLGTCTIDGASIISQRPGYTGGFDNCCAAIENRSDGRLTILGGEFYSASQSALFVDSMNAPVLINGGTFVGTAPYASMNGSCVDDMVQVRGGQFSSDVTVNVPWGYNCVFADGYYTVSQSEESGISVTTGDELVSIIDDAVGSTDYTVTISGSVSLDSDITIPRNIKIVIPSASTFTISKGVVVAYNGTIENNGTLVIDGYINNPTDIEGSGEITSDVNEGLNWESGEYHIGTAMDLQWLAFLLDDTNSGMSIILDNDVYLPKIEFEPIANAMFTGTFDGKGNTIYNLTMTSNAGDLGLFLESYGATFKNLRLSGVNITTQTGYVAPLVCVAYNGTTFKDIETDGTVDVKGTSYGSSGIVAYAYNDSDGRIIRFINCHSDVDVGGILAYNVGSMYGTSSGSYGGIEIYNCSNSGNITAQGSAGHVLGFGYLVDESKLRIYGFENDGKLIIGSVEEAEFTISTALKTPMDKPNHVDFSEELAIVNSGGNWTHGMDYVASADGILYEDINVPLKYAPEGSTVVIEKNLTADIFLTDGRSHIIDLHGHRITNVSGDTIYIGLGTTVTIIDSVGTGIVNNDTHQKAAIFNNGTLSIYGGTYTREKEDSSSNTYYNILNHGVLDFYDGKVTQSGNYSSLFVNGYMSYTNSSNERLGYVEGTNIQEPRLTIYSGYFSGGLNTLKNDDNGILTVNGGEFTNISQHALLNWNVATITDGIFIHNESAKKELICAAFTQSSDVNKGILNISGGVFETTKDRTFLIYDGATLTVTGGTFNTTEVLNHLGKNAKVNVVLQRNLTGPSIFISRDLNVNVDINLNGHTYTTKGPAVGSPGTETQAFHLEKNNTVTIRNGKITTTYNAAENNVKMLVQNYCDLTLVGVILDGTGLGGLAEGRAYYTLSNCNGNVVIKDSTIIQRDGYSFSFDIDKPSAYVGATVTIMGEVSVDSIEYANQARDDVFVITDDSTLYVSDRMVMNGNSVTLGEGAELVMEEGSEMKKGTIIGPDGDRMDIKGKLKANNKEIKFRGGSLFTFGDLTVVADEATEDAGVITVKGSNITISGALTSGTLEIQAGTSSSPTNVTFDSFNQSNGTEIIYGTGEANKPLTASNQNINIGYKGNVSVSGLPYVLPAPTTYTYNGTNQGPSTIALGSATGYSVESVAKSDGITLAADAGEYTAYYKVTYVLTESPSDLLYTTVKYTWSILPAEVTVIPGTVEKDYDGTTSVETGDVTFSSDLAAFKVEYDDKNAGSIIEVFISANDGYKLSNYKLMLGGVPDTELVQVDGRALLGNIGIINKIPISVSGLQDQVITYGDALPEDAGYIQDGGYNFSDRKGTDDLSLIFEVNTAGWPKVDDYAVNVILDGADSGNYDLATTTVTLIVKRATLTVKADDIDNWTYGSAAPALTVTMSGFKYDDTAALVSETTAPSVPYSGVSPFTPVGTYTIDAGEYTESSNNYLIVTQDGTLKVTPKVVTVTPAGSISREYNGDTDALLLFGDSNYVIVGNIDGLKLKIVPESAFFNSKNVDEANRVIVGGLTLDGSKSGNYIISTETINVVGVITPKNVTVDYDPSFDTGITKGYDGNTTATISPENYTIYDIIAGDEGLTISAASAYNQVNVGTTTVTVSGITLVGTETILASNYNLTTPNFNIPASITPKVLTIDDTATKVTKPYDGTTNASVSSENYAISGYENGETGLAIGSTYTATYNSSNVAEATTVTVTGITLVNNGSGAADPSNYTFTGDLVLTGEITAVSLTPGTSATFTYNGESQYPTANQITFSPATGDELNVEVTLNSGFNTVTAGDGKVNVSIDNSNYVLSQDYVTYTIKKLSLSSEDVEIEVTGTAASAIGATPTVTVKYNGEILSAEDYKLSFKDGSDNVVSVPLPSGSYKAVIDGKTPNTENSKALPFIVTYQPITLKLVDETGTASKEMEVFAGQTITLSAPGAVPGFEFIGWEINGLILGAQYTVTEADANSERLIEINAEWISTVDPSVVIDIPGNFVVGEEAVFSVTTFNGGYTGVNVLGQFIVTPGAQYTLHYLDNTNTWQVMPGDIFGDEENGFPLIDATSYFKVVFDAAGNYDLKVKIVKYDDRTDVCVDTDKIIVLAPETITTHKVTFTGFGSTTVVHGDSVLLPALPAKDGRGFLGWKIAGDDNTYNGYYVPDRDVTFTAEYESLAETVTVTIDGEIFTVVKGEMFLLPTLPDKADEYFVGWQIVENGPTYVGYYKVSDDVVFESVYVPYAEYEHSIEYYIANAVNGPDFDGRFTATGSGVEFVYSQDILEALNIVLSDPAKYTKENFVNLNDEEKQTALKAEQVMNDFAKYTSKLYITGGESISYNEVKYTWKEDAGQASRWFNGDTSLVSAVTAAFKSGSLESSINFEYSAQDDKAMVNYAVSFEVAEDERFTVKFGTAGEYGTVSVIAGGSVAMPSLPADNGKAFLGWKISGSDDGKVYNGYYEVTGTVTFVAEYDTLPQTFTVTLDGEEFTVVNGERFLLPTLPDKADEYFAGWEIGGSVDGKVYNGYYKVTGTVTFVAKYNAPETVRTCSVTLDEVFVGNYAVGEVVNLPVLNDTATKTFVGWLKSGTTEPVHKLAYTITEADVQGVSIAFTGHFETIAVFTVTLEGYGTVDAVMNEKVLLPTPSKVGQTFLGWTTEAEGTEYIQGYYKVTGTVILYPQFQTDPVEKVFTVTMVEDVVAGVTLAYNSKIAEGSFGLLVVTKTANVTFSVSATGASVADLGNGSFMIFDVTDNVVISVETQEILPGGFESFNIVGALPENKGFRVQITAENEAGLLAGTVTLKYTYCKVVDGTNYYYAGTAEKPVLVGKDVWREDFTIDEGTMYYAYAEYAVPGQTTATTLGVLAPVLENVQTQS